MGKHLPAIDGLRAFAVLAVVAYHAGLRVAAGYVGVDVFFVISGYVITRMLLLEPQIDLAGFYARRVRRILPALVVVVATVLLLSASLLSADLQIATNRSAVASMGMAANIWFQFHTGYFEPASDQMPLLHLWSLGVEEQFYLVWPLLLIAFKRKPWVLALLALASLGASQFWLENNHAAAFYQMPSRFWELAAGGLVAFAPKASFGRFAAFVGLPTLCLQVMVAPPDFPAMGAMLTVIGTALVLYSCHVGARIPILEWAPLRYVGLVSYSFYLWHWPLLALAKGYSYEAPTVPQNLALCALAFVLAALSYHSLEMPIRRSRAAKGKAIALGVIACVLVAGCAASVPQPTPKNAELSRIALHIPEVGCFYDSKRDSPRIGPECGAGDVLLWGDSHAYMWRPFADRFGEVTHATRSGCPPNIGTMEENRCGEFGRLALERAKQARIVVLAAHWATPNHTAGMREVLEALRHRRVVVIGPLPEMPYLPLKCLREDRIDMCQVPRAEFDARAEPLRRVLREAIAGHPNATLVDPTDFFCTATICPLMKDGYPLFRDLAHITDAAARGFAMREETTLLVQ